PRPTTANMEVRGRNLVSGLPKNITVTSEEMLEALQESVSAVVEAVHTVLEKTPPELASDIADRGIVMTGGGSLLYGLDKLLRDKTGINTIIAEEAVSCVAIGTGKYIEYLAAGKINTPENRSY
ncbi:MAG: rod shape-determining protein, partial [Defluviitaleaceae bacterium]|nr:rod shape-determining protein [Defluviitaleaceae bacterium]